MTRRYYATDFSLLLTEARQRQHKTLNATARAASLSPSTLFRYEHGLQLPRVGRLQNLSAAYNVPYDLLSRARIMSRAHTTNRPATDLVIGNSLYRLGPQDQLIALGQQFFDQPNDKLLRKLTAAHERGVRILLAAYASSSRAWETNLEDLAASMDSERTQAALIKCDPAALACFRPDGMTIYIPSPSYSPSPRSRGWRDQETPRGTRHWYPVRPALHETLDTFCAMLADRRRARSGLYRIRLD